MKKTNRVLPIFMAMTTVAGSITGCGGKNLEATSEYITAPAGDYVSETSAETYESDNDYEAIAEAESCYDEACTGAVPEETGILNFAKDATASSQCYDTEGCYSILPYEYRENTESYDKPDENGFFLTMTNPLSTFAADVDTASYANVRRMIENGYNDRDIPAEAVRPEEFINYFSYDLKRPDKGEKFGVTTEVSECPWNKDHQLMFVGIKAEDKLDGQIPESNLVFLIDVSGSMSSENKLELLKKAFTNLVDNLDGEGTVSIVTYASEEKVVLDGADMADKREIKKAIRSLYAEGSTAGERGMEMAYEIAKDNYIEGGNNRIIMATDGDLNVGISDPDELEEFITKKKDDGIFLSVLGFGDGNYKDDRLERLADCGNGNYSYIDSAMEAQKVLVDEMSSTLVTVAKDVKFQLEFNPAQVNAYRLIGYENRQMDDVSFNDDKKDGGEIGSGHSVVALYEIIPADSKESIELKYQTTDKGEYSDDFATIKIRYKEPDEDSSELLTYVIGDDSFNKKSGKNLAFAGLVAEFAMLLSDSEYSGQATYSDIVRELNELGENDVYKNEFIQLVWMVEKRS